MHARRTRIFPRARMYSSNSACMTKSSIVTEIKCKVHMRAFEIVAHRNVDNWTQ